MVSRSRSRTAAAQDVLRAANITFAAPGTYSYFCTVHVEMGGIITVVGPPEATATATATATAIPPTLTVEPTATTPAGADRYMPLLIAPPAAPGSTP